MPLEVLSKLCVYRNTRGLSIDLTAVPQMNALGAFCTETATKYIGIPLHKSYSSKTPPLLS